MHLPCAVDPGLGARVEIEVWLRRIAGKARQAFENKCDTQARQRYLAAGMNDRVKLTERPPMGICMSE